MAWQPKKLNATHQAILDILIEEPGLSHHSIGERLGRTPVGIGIIIRSDCFQAAYHERLSSRRKTADQVFAKKLEGVADKAIGAIEERLQFPGSIPFASLLDTAKMALDYTGRGPKSENGGVSLTVNNNAGFITVAPDVLRQAKERILNNETGSSKAGDSLLLEGKAESLSDP
jgi:hypothetical protein